MKAYAVSAVSFAVSCVAALMAPLETPPGDSSTWIGGNVATGVWVPLPGNDKVFGQPPSAAADSPYVYEYRLACVAADQAVFPECSAALPKCTAAKDGTAVYWYRSLRSNVPPVWIFDSGPSCIYGEKPRDVLAEIAAQIASEFQKSPVQPAVVGSQPGFHTLRGRETNVYATAQVQNFDLVMLGQKVHITATPAAYTYDYGDGAVVGPSPDAGWPLPEDRIGEQTRTSHMYTTTGRFSIKVVTDFTGTYTVNGGPALPIPGQGHIASTPVPLTVWRAIVRNYADDCITNPAGEGC